jgi:hypothetical protein
MTEPDFDLEDHRQRRADADAQHNQLRADAESYAQRRRAEGASYRKIADELGVSVATAHSYAPPFDADAWIRAKAGRGPTTNDDGAEFDGDAWLRNKTFGGGAYARKAAIRDRLAGRTEGDQR